jgi:hypothetical protein
MIAQFIYGVLAFAAVTAIIYFGLPVLTLDVTLVQAAVITFLAYTFAQLISPADINLVTMKKEDE